MFPTEPKCSTLFLLYAASTLTVGLADTVSKCPHLKYLSFGDNLELDCQTHGFLSTQACVETANEGIDLLLTISLEMTDLTD